jgi:lipooligosaccharide transport system permease protein
VSRRALHRIDPAAVAAVMSRDITLFRRFWPSTTFSSAVEPTIYLLAFGFGFGALVSRVDGIDYIAFVGTGIVATAVLYSSAFPGMFGAFVKRVFQRTYDAILATPVDPAELVTAEAVWIATRAGVYGCAPLLVALAFGLDPSPGMLLVPFVGFLTGFGFASFGIWVSGLVPTIDAFNYIVSTVLTPLFLVAGTFFPISALPDWAQTASWVNPLFHCVELVRHAAFGFRPMADLAHVGALLVFGLLTWTLAVRRLTAKLID